MVSLCPGPFAQPPLPGSIIFCPQTTPTLEKCSQNRRSTTSTKNRPHHNETEKPLMCQHWWVLETKVCDAAVGSGGKCARKARNFVQFSRNSQNKGDSDVNKLRNPAKANPNCMKLQGKRRPQEYRLLSTPPRFPRPTNFPSDCPPPFWTFSAIPDPHDVRAPPGWWR